MTAERDRLAALLVDINDERRAGAYPHLGRAEDIERLADRLIAAGVRLDAPIVLPRPDPDIIGTEYGKPVRFTGYTVDAPEGPRPTPPPPPSPADIDVERLARALRPYELPDPWTDGLRAVVMAGTVREVAAAIAAAYREDR